MITLDGHSATVLPYQGSPDRRRPPALGNRIQELLEDFNQRTFRCTSRPVVVYCLPGFEGTWSMFILTSLPFVESFDKQVGPETLVCLIEGSEID